MKTVEPLETTISKLPQSTNGSLRVSELLRQYGCGPIPFVGTENAFYERHLIFDRVIDSKVATARERFEAFARSVRDILAQRWVLTKKTYERQNPKRIYYLSMEFLIGRSSASNITNLLLDPLIKHAANEAGIDWLNLIEEEPDAGLGNGGLGRLAACFLDSMATMQLPATGYGLRYEYGMFRQSIVNGRQKENADNWLRQPDPWEVPRPTEKVEVKLNCSVQARAAGLKCSLAGLRVCTAFRSIVPWWATEGKRSTLSVCGRRLPRTLSILRSSGVETLSEPWERAWRRNP